MYGTVYALADVVERPAGVAEEGPQVPQVRQQIVRERPDQPSVDEPRERVDHREEHVVRGVGLLQTRDRLRHAREALDPDVDAEVGVAMDEPVDDGMVEVVAPFVDPKGRALFERCARIEAEVLVDGQRARRRRGRGG